MNRRSLITGLLGAGVALVLPPTLAANVEAARRYWALDQSMVARPGWKPSTYWIARELRRPIRTHYLSFDGSWNPVAGAIYTDVRGEAIQLVYQVTEPGPHAIRGDLL